MGVWVEIIFETTQLNSLGACKGVTVGQADPASDWLQQTQ